MANIFSKIDKLKPVYDVVYKVVLFICKLLLIGDILITCFSVLGRYISFIPDPTWTEEIVLTLMSYMAVLSAALAIKKKSHIRMTALDRFLPSFLIKALDLLSDVCILALAVGMITVGWKYAVTIGSKGYYVSIPSLSRAWKYYPIPLAGLAMFVFELEAIYEDIKVIVLKKEITEKAGE